MTDGDGLTLVVRTTGKKSWWFRYRFGGIEKTLTLGDYPAVTLNDARTRTLDARKMLANGQDPSADKQERKAKLLKAKEEAKKEITDTVEAIAREWYDRFSSQWVDAHGARIIRRLERDLFPYLGNKQISLVKPADLLAVARRVETRGAVETAHRLIQNCSQVWRYAVSTDRAEIDITGSLRGAIPPSTERHLGALTDPDDIRALLLNIDEYRGSEVVRLALKLAPLVFVRPGELRQAEWSEIDAKKALWTIPAGRMKARRPHVVPLSRQSLSILMELRTLTGSGKYLFPTPRSNHRCLSDAALIAALRRMGYKPEEMTAHGFRAMASTNLEQLKFDVRLIELQLAHADADAVRAAYKRETHLLRLTERKEMMQAWADWLDKLKLDGIDK